MERSGKPQKLDLEKLIQLSREQSQIKNSKTSMANSSSAQNIPERRIELTPRHIPPKDVKPLKVDIITPDRDSKAVKTFLAYLADKGGLLDEIYREIVINANREIDRLRREYELKLLQMKRTKNFKQKIKMPPERVNPEKKFLEMFEEYLYEEELDHKDGICMKIDDRWFKFEVMTKDDFTFDRVQNLPEAAIIFVEAEEDKFKQQFSRNLDIKSALIMHIFFGTQKLFFMYYFDYEDMHLKYEYKQEPIAKKIEEELQKIFDYLEDEFEAPVSRVEKMSVCIKKRLDRPDRTSKVLHIREAKKLFLGKTKFAKKKDRAFVWFPTDWLEEVMGKEDMVKLLMTRPPRFMVYEAYIAGGVGCYVLGDVLAGTIKLKQMVTLHPGELKSDINFIERDKKLVREAYAGDTVALSLPMIKTSLVKRGMCMSVDEDKPAKAASELDYALGIFFGCDFKGEVTSGMRFFLVNNRISRMCEVEVDCLIDLSGDLIGKKEADQFKKSDIVFLKIRATEEELLILEDPLEIPEFTLVKLRDNCQEVALGKIYRVAYMEDRVDSQEGKEEEGEDPGEEGEVEINGKGDEQIPNGGPNQFGLEGMNFNPNQLDGFGNLIGQGRIGFRTGGNGF